MCLVVFSVNSHPRYPLIIAANRDEFFERPTQAVHHWHDDNNILAGRDQVAGGTWLGITKTGRFSALTNIRQFPQTPAILSRGALVSDFLKSNLSPERYSKQVSANANKYSGYNLFVGNIDNHKNTDLTYSNNKDQQIVRVQTGIHGISNGTLSARWQKVTNTQDRFIKAIQQPFKRDDLLAVLRHQQPLDDHALPVTGAPIDFEQQLSRAFIPTFEINNQSYGTRSQALITVNNDLKATFYEIQLNDMQKVVSEKQFVMQLTPD